MKELVVEKPRTLSLRSYTERDVQQGEVLLKTLYSGISTGTELRNYRGLTSSKVWDHEWRLYRNQLNPESWPRVIGYETISIVQNIGSGVESIRQGSLVWVDRPHRQTHIVSEAEALYGLLLSPEELADQFSEKLKRFVFVVRARAALNGIHDGQIALGDQVAIIGTGVIGLLALQFAKLSGASVVYGVDFIPQRLNFVSQLGGVPVNAQDHAALAIKQASNGGVDVAIEASGSSEGLYTAIQCCRVGGRVVTIGTYSETERNLYLGGEWSRNRITLLSSMSTNGCLSRRAPCWDKRRLDQYAITLLKKGTLQTLPLITHSFPFSHAIQTFKWLDHSPQEALQIVFTYPEDSF